MMKMIVPLVVFLLLSRMAFLPFAQAVSYPVPQEQEEKVIKRAVTVGSRVCMFQSGTADVKETIHVRDIMIVYRESPMHKFAEVGKVRVLSYVGEDYLWAEVVEGEVMPGDIAKKGDVASMIISAEDKCK
jgi:hypothetical protein